MTFGRILGHEKQKNILRRAITSNKLAHAYLFVGPDGIGKRLMALALARAVFCTEGDGCGDCPQCRKVDHLNHPDLISIEPDGAAIKIEQIREVQRQLAFHPFESKSKICIIDRAEKMNEAAANALLKTLEEPRSKTLLILLTSSADVMLQTIKSRCQHLPFNNLPQTLLTKALSENLKIEQHQANILAALANGSFEKALGKDRDLFIEERKTLLKTLTSLSKGSVMPLCDFAEELSADREKFENILEIFQSFYRDILFYLHRMPQEELMNRDIMEKLHRVSQEETVDSILKKLKAIQDCRYHIQRNLNRQLAAEVLLQQLSV